QSKNCPPGGGLDSVFVVAQEFGSLITGLELAVNFPGTMIWLADVGTPPVTFGDSQAGISMGFPAPEDGFGRFAAYKIMFNWNCTGCGTTDDPAVVVPHPVSGFVGATGFPAFQPISAVGMTSLVCATVPVEDTTWGRVKALYSATP
ncbi:MAG: hypothetical protein ACYSWU_29685, partial [Planctomycetota bacterium]